MDKQKQLIIALICCGFLYVIMGTFKERWIPNHNNYQSFPYELKPEDFSLPPKSFVSNSGQIISKGETVIKQNKTQISKMTKILESTKESKFDNTSTTKILSTTSIPTTSQIQTTSHYKFTTTTVAALIENVDCKRVIDGQEDSVEKARSEVARMNSKEFEDIKQKYLSDDRVALWTKDCSKFKHERKYIMEPMSGEERDYPIAYIISVYKGLLSFENLLRLIYHPQNIYCIHIDQKSDPQFQKRVKEIVGCFDNVFLASTMTKVYYTHWTIVQSSLNCLTDLIGIKKSHEWKYVFNLCGLDFPTKTNLEIVRALKNLNNTNSIHSVNFNNRKNKIERYTYEYQLPQDIVTGHEYLVKTDVKKEPPPHGIEMFSGTDYFIWTRKAVEYFMSDPKIHDFMEWNKNTFMPDEHFWATIQRMYPQVPGSLPPAPEYRLEENDVITRTRTWAGDQAYTCKAEYVRGICMYGVSALNWLVQQKGLFANKVDPQIDLVAFECLSEWIQNRAAKTLTSS